MIPKRCILWCDSYSQSHQYPKKFSPSRSVHPHDRASLPVHVHTWKLGLSVTGIQSETCKGPPTRKEKRWKTNMNIVFSWLSLCLQPQWFSTFLFPIHTLIHKELPTNTATQRNSRTRTTLWYLYVHCSFWSTCQSSSQTVRIKLILNQSATHF